MLNKILNVEVSDTRDNDSSNAVCSKISDKNFKRYYIPGSSNNIKRLLRRMITSRL